MAGPAGGSQVRPRARRRPTVAVGPGADRRDLTGSGLGRDRVLACAARLLQIGFFRVGGEQYAEQNGSYGLATIRREHISIGRDGLITFDYPAKSGRQRVQSIADEDVVTVVRALRRRRSGGPELLAYKGDGGWRDVRSGDINSYLREVFDVDVSAKDFRTWNATVLAAVGLAVSDHAAASPTARKRAVTRVIKEVAEYLGNTPAVCRSSYVDSRLVDRYLDGESVRPVIAGLGDGIAVGDLATHGAVESAVLRLLQEDSN